MRITLVNPPLGSLTQPFLALASLQAYLKENGYADVTIVDVSQRLIRRFLTSARVERLRDEISEVIERLESQDRLSTPEAMHLEVAHIGRVAALEATRTIDESVTVLRDPELFYVENHYEQAMRDIERVFEALSGLHFPQRITKHNYSGSLLQDLDDDDELRAYLTTPERCMFHAEYLDGFVREIVDLHPNVVGLSATFQDQFLPALVLARLLDEHLPNAHIVLGGAFPSARVPSLAARPWLFDFIDSIVVNEGETGLLELCRAVERGVEPVDVPNLMRRDGNTVVGVKQRVYENLRELPVPDYTGFDIADYLVPCWDVLYDPTRGCYWNKCTFCTVSMSTKGSDRVRDPVRTVDDIERLCDTYDTNVVSFAVDAIPIAWMREVGREIIRRGLDISWSSECILDKRLDDDETVEIFAKSGCLLLLFGLESGSPTIVRAMKKGTVVDRSCRIIRACSERGIGVLLHLMVGYPGETQDDVEATLRLVEELGPWLDLYELNPFHLDDGAPMALMLDSIGISSSGRTRREFNIETLRAYRTSHGVQPDEAAELLEGFRERVDRATGLTGRRYLREDGAPVHLYMKTLGKRVRDMRSSHIAGPLSSWRLKRDIAIVRSPYDIAGMSEVLSMLRLEHQRRTRVEDTDGSALWREIGTAEFVAIGGFAGIVDADRSQFVRLNPVALRMAEQMRERPELLSGLDRLPEHSRALVAAAAERFRAHDLLEVRA